MLDTLASSVWTKLFFSFQRVIRLQSRGGWLTEKWPEDCERTEASGPQPTAAYAKVHPHHRACLHSVTCLHCSFFHALVHSFSFPLHGFQKSLREEKLQLWEALARLQPIFRTKPALPAPRHSRLPTLLFATPLNTLAFYLPSHPLGASLLSKRPPWGFPGSPQLGLCLPLQGALGSVPGRGTKNPHAIRHKPLPQKGPPGARGKV